MKMGLAGAWIALTVDPGRPIFLVLAAFSFGTEGL